MELHPDQFGHLMGTDPGVRGKSVSDMAETYYQREPEYMSRLERHVQEHGFQTPVGIRMNHKKNKFGIEQGHHRAAVAHRLGMSMPVRDLDEVSPSEAMETRGNHESWDNTRNSQEQAARSQMGERGRVR